jgi:hypothetical protein
MELALYTSNRLRLYLETHARLPPSPASENFRTALVHLYAHILQFLAHAIRIQQAGKLSRAAQALWDTHELAQFEEKCDILCARASEEARICDNKTSEQWRESIQTQLQSLDEIHNIHSSLVHLHDKVDLSGLITAKEATYDSSAEGGLSRCLPGTRTDILREIDNWTRNYQGERIFWLCGKAGIGKSTISRHVAEDLDRDHRLGASFFFKRGRADRSHASLFFPTIARQLADKLPALRHEIAAAVEDDSLLHEKYMTKQFERLLLQPMRKGLLDTTIVKKDRFLVVDALDECENVEQVETLIKLLKRFEDVPSARIRIFVTSRPDHPLLAGFKDIKDTFKAMLKDIRVEEAQTKSIKSDLTVFFRHQFDDIRNTFLSRNPFGSLPEQWPGQDHIELLVEKSNPLFIVAFTIYNILASSNKPRDDLCMLLSQTQSHSLSSGLGTVYLPVLRQAIAVAKGLGTEDGVAIFKMVIGSLILLYDPLSATALSNLLGIAIGDVGVFIPPLRSVLHLTEKLHSSPDPLGTIKLFHLSFRDFLTDPALHNVEGGEFWINEALAHSKLAGHCLSLLSSGALKQDVCGVKAPGIRRVSVSKAKVISHLPEAVRYACCYWVQHLVKSGEQIDDNGTVQQFLNQHLLHWFEALSWLGKTTDIIHHLEALKSVACVCSKPMIRLLHSILTCLLMQ